MELRLQIAELVASGNIGAEGIARQYGLGKQTVRYWAALYKAQGASAFQDTGKNAVYPPELKMKAVLSYLQGEGSYEIVAAKYGLSRDAILKQWVKMYNDGKDFSQHKMSGGSRMTTSRKTDKEERVKIAKECIENGKNYGEIALKYKVSYQQVYSWVKRYSELGEAGLEDRRGRRKVDQEPRSEIEELKIKLAQTEHELYMTKMERDLLKKVKELERKDLYRK